MKTLESRFVTVLLLILMMLGAGAISVFLLSHLSLRLDESQSLWQTSHTPGKILYIVAQDVHIPLYHMILHFWQVFLGNGVATARYLSLIFFLLTIPASYLLGKEAYGKRLGLFVALLFTISPFLNWYGNEIRMYSLMTLLTVLSHYFFLRLRSEQEDGPWWPFFLVSVLGMYTHYFFLFVLITQGTFLLLTFRSYSLIARKRFAVMAVSFIVLFSPWVAYVIHLGSANNSRPMLVAPSSGDIFNTLSQFLFGFQTTNLNTAIISLWPLLILLGFLSLRKGREIPSQTLYFLMTAAIPVAGAFILSLTVQPLFLSRYLIIAIPSFYLFIVWLFDSYSLGVARFLKFALVVTMAVTLGIQTASSKTPVKEDYRAVTQYLSENVSARDVVVVSAPFTVYPLEYYYPGPASLETLPRWNQDQAGAIPAFSEANLPADVAAITGDHQTAWVVLSYDQGYEKNIKDYFDSHYERLKYVTFSPGLTVAAYKLRYN